MRFLAQSPFRNNIFLLFAAMAATNSHAATITVTSSNGTFSPVNRITVQSAFDAAACGDEVQIEAGAIVRTGIEGGEITISGANMTVTAQYPHHFAVGDFVLITNLSGVLAPLTRDNYQVTSVPAPNIAVIDLRQHASTALNGTYLNTGVQMFGRRFVINYDPLKKNCSEGNEITITTTKKDWLPDADMRITPSYRPLIPTLQLVGDSSNNALLQVADKVAGLKFVGVGFQKLSFLQYTQYSFIEISSSYFITDESQLAQRIGFDRSLFYLDHKLGNAWKNTVNLRGKGFTFTNNFVDDLMGLPADGETYISAVGTAFGPFKIRNNYICCAIGIPFLWGARALDYSTDTPNSNDILLEHNSFYTSPKHYPTSPTYVGDAYHGIVKNCSELKGAVNAIFRWNTCENQFSGGGAQWFGFTFSARSAGSPRAGTCSLDGSRTVITCPQLDEQNPIPGIVIGVDTGLTGDAKYQWRTVVSINKVTRSYTVSQPFSVSVGTTNLSYAYIPNPMNKVDNVQVYGNYFKNVASMSLILGEDEIYPVRTENISFKNNLMVYDSPYFRTAPGLQFYVAPFVINRAGKNYQFTNNTTYTNPNWQPDIPYRQTMRVLPSKVIENIRFHNNLMPYDYIGGDSGQTISLLSTAGLVPGASFRNNTLVGSGAGIQPCSPSECNGNFVNGTYSPRFRNAEKNDFGLVPGSNYTNAGTDGSDLGADIEEVAIIRELTVKANSHSLLFSWRVPTFMKNMGCQLEVSPDSNLINDLGNYTVVNSLRPDYFIRADSDRSNKRATSSGDGLLRWFQVGQNVEETDDNGDLRNLALSSDTDYHYRLMCGGATERGSIRTEKEPSDTVNRSNIQVEIRAKANKGTQIRPRFGVNKLTVASAPAQTCTSECVIQLSGVVGSQLIYYLDELDQLGNLVFQSTRPTVLFIR